MPETHENQKQINDNIMNAVSLIGIQGKAKNPSTVFGTPVKLADGELENIYQGDGFGKKIIDIYANAMTSKWFKVKGDPDEEILTYLANINTKISVNETIKWSRLYGTAVIVMLIDDGNMLEDPVDINAIQSIADLRVVDKTQISVENSSDLYDDPDDPNFGKIRVYTISPPQNVVISSGQAITSYRVHQSRILRFDGEIAPPRLMVENGYFGFSVFQGIYNYIKNLAGSYEISAEILQEFVISVFTMKNLSSILSRPGGAEAIKKRAETMAYCKSVINGVIIDADGESFNKLTTSLAGLAEILDKFALALSAVTGIPYMLLMGDSASGLNANGDNDVRTWYDSIANEQHEIMTVQLNKLLTYILASSDNPLKGKTMDDIEIVYNPLWQQSDQELVDMRNKQAQSDQIYIETGVTAPEEIAISRFGGDAYSFETTIDTSDR